MCSAHRKYMHIPCRENKIHLGTLTIKPIKQLEEVISCDSAEHQPSPMVVAACWRWKEVAASPDLPCLSVTCTDSMGWTCLRIQWVHVRAQERLDISPKIKNQKR